MGNFSEGDNIYNEKNIAKRLAT